MSLSLSGTPTFIALIHKAGRTSASAHAPQTTNRCLNQTPDLPAPVLHHDCHRGRQALKRHGDRMSESSPQVLGSCGSSACPSPSTAWVCQATNGCLGSAGFWSPPRDAERADHTRSCLIWWVMTRRPGARTFSLARAEAWIGSVISKLIPLSPAGTPAVYSPGGRCVRSGRGKVGAGFYERLSSPIASDGQVYAGARAGVRGGGARVDNGQRCGVRA